MFAYISNYDPRHVPWENQFQASLWMGAIGALAVLIGAFAIIEGTKWALWLMLPPDDQ